MRNLFTATTVILLAVYSISCQDGNTDGNTDTSRLPAVADTMPVLHPGNRDSMDIIRTPPTNDSIAIMPDSAIKNK